MISRTIIFVPFSATYVVKGVKEFFDYSGQLMFTSCGEKETAQFPLFIRDEIAAHRKDSKVDDIVVIDFTIDESFSSKVSMSVSEFVAFGHME